VGNLLRILFSCEIPFALFLSILWCREKLSSSSLVMFSRNNLSGGPLGEKVSRPCGNFFSLPGPISAPDLPPSPPFPR